VLAELARDPERRAALGRAARSLIAELCGTWEQRMRRELEIIERVAHTRAVVAGNLVSGGAGGAWSGKAEAPGAAEGAPPASGFVPAAGDDGAPPAGAASESRGREGQP